MILGIGLSIPERIDRIRRPNGQQFQDAPVAFFKQYGYQSDIQQRDIGKQAHRINGLCIQ